MCIMDTKLTHLRWKEDLKLVICVEDINSEDSNCSGSQ